MINISLNTLYFRPEFNQKIVSDTADFLCDQLSALRGPLPDDYETAENFEKRTRYSFQWLVSHRENTPFNQEDLQNLFNIANTPKTDKAELRDLYIKLTGRQPKYIDDVNGLKGPIKALMILLWSNKQLLLPILFDKKGMSKAFPDIYNITDGFVAEIVLHCSNRHLVKYFRAFVYTVDWAKPKDVTFLELWDATPKLLEVIKQYKALNQCTEYPRHYCILGFAALLAIRHPGILTSKQIILLEKYLQSLSISRHLEKNISTPEEFEKYLALSAGHKLRHRQQINGTIKVKRHPGLEHASDNPEEYFAALSTQKRGEGLNWLNGGYYRYRPELDLSTAVEWWKPAIEDYQKYLNGRVAKSRRGQLKSFLNILCDYVFCYIPHWCYLHPDSPVRPPLKIDDFHRELFWNRQEYEQEEGENSFRGVELPKTAMEMFKTRRSPNQLTPFIVAIDDFFKYCISHRKQIKLYKRQAISDSFDNPVIRKFDTEGSGPRGNTDKIVLPLKSVPYAEAYTHILNAIGVDLQRRLLAGELQEQIKIYYGSSHIDLDALNLKYTIEIPGNEVGKTITVPIHRIPNCYSWKRGSYKREDGSIIEAKIPHLGVLRMLMVALHAGQRVQNSQWLDLDTFDEYERFSPDNTSFLATLFINTDKTDPERTVSIQRSVFNMLLEEKRFQLEVMLEPPKKIKYENDDFSQYNEYRPLFRSPFTGRGLPFSDNTYSDIWVKILIGLQDIYNYQKPESEHHHFVYYNGRAHRAVHTPHALRTTWVTWMRLYGGLEYVLIMKQVGHSEITMSFHYTAPDVLETNTLIEQAFHQRNQAASTENHFNLITSMATRPSLETSALRSGLLFNPQATIEQQRLFSVSSQFVESKQTGLGMIDVLNLGNYGYYDDCICPFNGKCPKALLNFTGMARCCSICPFAIWGLDHLEGVEAKKRFYQLRVNHLLQVFDHLIERKEEKAAEEIRADLSLASLELAGYHQISSVIRSELEKSANIKNSFAMRRPEILEKHCKIQIDINHPGWRYVSNLIDLKNYPQFCADSYLQILNRFSRNLPPPGIKDEKRTPLDRVLAQISATMKSEGINLSQLADRLSSDQYRIEAEEHE
ncbi:hypothetical protein [Pseudomonas sp. BIC9C]|uniref:hypothetical protein n=1 Tax=Pseudomonas sp. BIC9C TaxID=3078458 RepID=UPI002AD2A492|nr:hypothetical protein [Pseudomonas sp. BIC9C]